MMKKLITGLAMLLLLGGTAQNSFALFGAYADIPLSFSFSDCTTKCSQTPSGAKTGILLMGLGLGIEKYDIKDTGLEVNYNIYDVSYLLPIPVINLTLGLGVGNADVTLGANSKASLLSQTWGSLGFPIAGPLDLHIGYHNVNAQKVNVGGIPINPSGTMWSLGALLNF